MTGQGQIRSQWNCLLLSDVIAPLYARLLLLARDIVGKENIYYSLFPTCIRQTTGGEVWKLVKRSLYLLLSSNDWKVFYSPLNDGTWVSLKDALAVALNHDEDKNITEISTGIPASSLIPILIQEKLNVVPLPIQNIHAIKEYVNIIQEVSPSYIRDWFRHKDQRHDKSNILMLLKYCLQDLNSDTFHELSGLKWIFLINEDYGVFKTEPSSKFFICKKIEKDLLPQSLDRLVNVWTEDEVVNEFFKKLTHLSIPSPELRINVKQMEIQDFVNLMSAAFPSEWQDFMEVRWTPAPLDSRDHPVLLRPRSELWLKNLWQYLIRPSSSEEDEGKQENMLSHFVNKWQILPTTVTNQNEKTLCKLVHNLPIVSPLRDSSASIISEKVMNVLQDIGIRILDIQTFFPSNRQSIVSSLIQKGFVQPPTTKGILQGTNLYFLIDFIYILKNSLPYF